ncbi:hypothetical protein [Candidatus Aquicultor secundus]|nr:hypothetical protein [Candidatus Aquicultor secundus]
MWLMSKNWSEGTAPSPRDVIGHPYLKGIEFSGKLLVNVIEATGKEDKPL